MAVSLFGSYQPDDLPWRRYCIVSNQAAAVPSKVCRVVSPHESAKWNGGREKEGEVGGGGG